MLQFVFFSICYVHTWGKVTEHCSFMPKFPCVWSTALIQRTMTVSVVWFTIYSDMHIVEQCYLMSSMPTISHTIKHNPVWDEYSL